MEDNSSARDLIDLVAYGEERLEQPDDDDGFDRCMVCLKPRRQRKKLSADGWTCGDCRTQIKRSADELRELHSDKEGFRKGVHLTDREKKDVKNWRQWFERGHCSEAERDAGIALVHKLAETRYQQEQKAHAKAQFDEAVGKVSRGVDGGDIEHFGMPVGAIQPDEPLDYELVNKGYSHHHLGNPPREDVNDKELYTKGLVGSHKLARKDGEKTVRETAEEFQKQRKRG